MEGNVLTHPFYSHILNILASCIVTQYVSEFSKNFFPSNMNSPTPYFSGETISHNLGRIFFRNPVVGFLWAWERVILPILKDTVTDVRRAGNSARTNRGRAMPTPG